MAINYLSSYLKLILISLCIILFTNTLRSQSYISMLDTYAEWHVTNCNSGCMTDKYYTIGDTIINGLHYKFLDKYHYNKNFVIREDTSSRQIHMRLLADPAPAKEYLLYDFSLQVNDTISITNPGSPYPKYPGIFIVDSIISRLLVNKSHRYFYLHADDTLTANTKTTIWVEGIGSLCLINTPGALPQANGVGKLSCFFNNGINEYMQLDSIANCISVYPVGIKELSTESNYIIHQNFDSNCISIFSKKEEIECIEIYSTVGRLEYQKIAANNKETIQISNLTKGLLLLRIKNKSNNYYTYKVFNP